MKDCSCKLDCILSGNCCSDYHECENTIKIHKKKLFECQSKVKNCEFCDFSKSNKTLCKQCNKGFYLRNGECVKKCFPSDSIKEENKICIKNQKQECRIENCSECVEGNSAICNYCSNGFFMHNNKCLAICPIKFRADRISWNCIEPPVFAWYWIFPSKNSCEDNCGKSFILNNTNNNSIISNSNSSDFNCSCEKDCFRLGNCCQDIEEFCESFVFWK
jgi:hypothetical protein